MFFSELQMFLITMFAVCILGYIFVVIKEKINLRDNTIVIDKKSVTQDYINEAEVKTFRLGNQDIRAGDEIKLVLLSDKKIEGIVIGAKLNNNEIMLVTYKDEVKKLKVDMIKKIRIVSRYGKFFKSF